MILASPASHIATSIVHTLQHCRLLLTTCIVSAATLISNTNLKTSSSTNLCLLRHDHSDHDDRYLEDYQEKSQHQLRDHEDCGDIFIHYIRVVCDYGGVCTMPHYLFGSTLPPSPHQQSSLLTDTHQPTFSSPPSPTHLNHSGYFA